MLAVLTCLARISPPSQVILMVSCFSGFPPKTIPYQLPLFVKDLSVKLRPTSSIFKRDTVSLLRWDLGDNGQGQVMVRIILGFPTFEEIETRFLGTVISMCHWEYSGAFPSM